MLARVTFELDGRAVVATLGDDRLWHCPGWATLEGMLNSVPPYSLEDRDGPEYGEPGHEAAQAVAARFGGTVELPARTPAPPGVDY